LKLGLWNAVVGKNTRDVRHDGVLQCGATTRTVIEVMRTMTSVLNHGLQLVDIISTNAILCASGVRASAE
jgi:hypothetical protein